MSCNCVARRQQPAASNHPWRLSLDEKCGNARSYGIPETNPFRSSVNKPLKLLTIYTIAKRSGSGATALPTGGAFLYQVGIIEPNYCYGIG